MKYTLGEYLDILEKNSLVSDKNINANQVISHVSYNSRDIKPDTLFICKGAHFKDEYLLDAQRQGAVCYISERKMSADCQYILVNDVRAAIPLIADMYYEQAWE